MVNAPVFNRSGKIWRDFKFENLEKVSRAQMQLTRRLEWLLPGISSTGHASENVRSRLTALFDEEVRLVIDYVHVIPPKQLTKYVAEPTFLTVLAPQPHKTRGFLEVELGFAHEMIDVLLGGAGEAVALRPLTDIEEGVMTYVIIETLKALTPHIDPGLPRLRLENVCRGVDEAIHLLGDEKQVAVVQLKGIVGRHSGYIRLFIPATLLGMVTPPSQGTERRARRAAEAAAHLKRLAGVQTWLRAEIGHAEISSTDLKNLSDGDVVVLEELTARPDLQEGGAAKLKVGLGQVGHLDAEIAIVEDRYQATITGFAFVVSSLGVFESEGFKYGFA
jgi:flagellar motor switch protein FliM